MTSQFSEAAKADIVAIHDRVTAIALDYDTRILAAVLANRTACAYAALIRAKVMTTEQVHKMMSELTAYTLEMGSQGPAPRTVLLNGGGSSESAQ